MKLARLNLGLIAVNVLMFTGCASGPRPEPKIITQEVAAPVAVSCVPQSLRSAPSYPDSDEALAALDLERAFKVVLAGRDLRVARLSELEPVLKGCRAAGH